SAAGRGGLTAGVFNDLATEREVQQLTVRCPRTGCGAAMELGGLRSHLATACQFVEELCPSSASPASAAATWPPTERPAGERQVACVFCSASVPYRQLNFHYLFGCSNFPMPCPHRCGRVLAGHQRLHEHVDRACPLTLVLCPFASFGCPAANRHSARSRPPRGRGSQLPSAVAMATAAASSSAASA
uniref:TRAF-type domain-containing protein n=1 Tax=Macrostomum lignano TaxID=282301 RepID=A0A1I8HGE4_9PLAT